MIKYTIEYYIKKKKNPCRVSFFTGDYASNTIIQIKL